MSEDDPATEKFRAGRGQGGHGGHREVAGHLLGHFQRECVEHASALWQLLNCFGAARPITINGIYGRRISVGTAHGSLESRFFDQVQSSTEEENPQAAFGSNPDAGLCAELCQAALT
ncbi:hypothetical protein DFH06DRAFT_1135341 [Mycena polygramma]|nr:hypothetical protein DFH06DRAFT_1135341 [Mycena polygramma]